SDDKGRLYSNFYGGILIDATNQEKLEAEPQACKNQLNIFGGEMKWARITDPYVEKNTRFVNTAYDIVSRGDMKIRVMFTQNRNRPILEEYQIGNDYFMLYYQFIKHAFGLQFAVPEGGTASAAVLLDDVPHDAEKLHQFKKYLSGLSDFPKWT